MIAEQAGSLTQKLEREMRDAARELEFEQVTMIRDRIHGLRELMVRLP